MKKKHMTWDGFCGMDDKDAFNEINRLAAEADELQRRLDAIVAIANNLPDKLYVYRELAGVTYKDRSAKDELIAIAEGKP